MLGEDADGKLRRSVVNEAPSRAFARQEPIPGGTEQRAVGVLRDEPNIGRTAPVFQIPGIVVVGLEVFDRSRPLAAPVCGLGQHVPQKRKVVSNGDPDVKRGLQRCPGSYSNRTAEAVVPSLVPA